MREWASNVNITKRIAISSSSNSSSLRSSWTSCCGHLRSGRRPWLPLSLSVEAFWADWHRQLRGRQSGWPHAGVVVENILKFNLEKAWKIWDCSFQAKIYPWTGYTSWLHTGRCELSDRPDVQHYPENYFTAQQKTTSQGKASFEPHTKVKVFLSTRK